MSMSSSRPYLIRSLYEWILDNDCTPYLLVNALGDDVQVPRGHVKDGQIILNISPTAVQSLDIENDALQFKGRFAGIPFQVFVPIEAVLGIYAKENGQGMFFESESSEPQPPAPDESSSGQRARSGKPSLRVVK
jgi:stringent starvation protein B